MTARATAVFEFSKGMMNSQEFRDRLDWTLPEVNTVRAYWREQAKHVRISRPNSKKGKLTTESDKGWVLGSDDDATRFHGPGSISVWFCPRHVEIHSGCRWTGFLTIQRLRNVHLQAFHRIASVFKGVSLIIMPSDSQA
jgi:hypothetical protein